jgi:hypothetical protein
MAATKPQSGSGGRRTQVDAIDALTAEIRTSNLLAVLAMGVTALEHDEGKRATTDIARARTAQRNELRAAVRAGLGIGEVRDGDRS